MRATSVIKSASVEDIEDYARSICVFLFSLSHVTWLNFVVFNKYINREFCCVYVLPNAHPNNKRYSESLNDHINRVLISICTISSYLVRRETNRMIRQSHLFDSRQYLG